MYYKNEFSLRDFPAWSGAVSTKKEILEAGLGAQFETLLEDIYCDEIPTETTINDFLWFEYDFICESLGMNNEENEEE